MMTWRKAVWMVMGLVLLIGAMPAVAQNEAIPACRDIDASNFIDRVQDARIVEKIDYIIDYLTTDADKITPARMALVLMGVDEFQQDWLTIQQDSPECSAIIETDITVTQLIAELSRLAGLYIVNATAPSVHLQDRIETSQGLVETLRGEFLVVYDAVVNVKEKDASVDSSSQNGLLFVEYLISGSADGADITFTNNTGGTSRLWIGRLPYSITFYVSKGTLLYVSAESGMSGGTVNCALLVDYSVVQAQSAAGINGSVTCTFPLQ